LIPRWKPDGSMLSYTGGDDVLYTIPPLGGSPTAMIGSAAPGPFVDCNWSPTGDRMACSNPNDGAIYVGDGDGHNFKNISPKAHDPLHSAAWSPDGKRIAFVSGNEEFLLWGNALGNLAGSSIWVIPATGGTPVRITDETHLNTSPLWSPDGGHVLFVSSLGGARDIYSQRVKSSGEPDGPATRLTTGLNPHTISLSSDGHSLAYSTFTTTGNVWKAAIRGPESIAPESIRQVTFGNQTIEQMAVSRDEHWLAYDSNVSGNDDIYKVSLDGGEPQQLTHDPADDFSPAWSPDGTQIAFHSFRNGNRDVFVMSADGSRTETVVATPQQERLATWSGDGRSIAYVQMPDSIFIVSRTASGWGKPRYFTRGTGAVWSPDGKIIAVAAAAGMEFLRTDATLVGSIPLKTVGQTPSSLTGAGAWSADSRLYYYTTAAADGTNMIAAFEVATNASRIVYHFSDPLRQPYRPTMSASSKEMFFTIGTRESDVWVMELNRK
jgi:Tol biopolymer transport system component